MGLTSFSSSVSSVVRLLNGFVGAILISVSRVIRNSAMAIMCQNIRESSCQNVRDLENARLEEIMGPMEMKKCLDAQSVETTKKTLKTSDSSLKLLRLNINSSDMPIYCIFYFFFS